MHYGTAKDRLPSGLGYPLKRAQLDAALSAPCIERVGWVAFSRRRGDAVLTARYWAQDNNQPGDPIATEQKTTIFRVGDSLKRSFPRIAKHLRRDREILRDLGSR